jgi:hypothetical protein
MSVLGLLFFVVEILLTVAVPVYLTLRTVVDTTDKYP